MPQINENLHQTADHIADVPANLGEPYFGALSEEQVRQLSRVVADVELVDTWGSPMLQYAGSTALQYAQKPQQQARTHAA